jgi:hypothetical protein
MGELYIGKMAKGKGACLGWSRAGNYGKPEGKKGLSAGGAGWIEAKKKLPGRVAFLLSGEVTLQEGNFVGYD